MKVTGVSCLLLSAPYAQPGDRERELYLKSGYRSHAFIRIETDEGLEGIGETYAGVFAPEAVRALVQQFERELLDHQPVPIQPLRERLRVASHYWGRAGLSQSVLGGIEIALWDLMGKLVDQPVYELLGGRAHKSITAYASGGTAESVNGLADEVVAYAGAGFSAVKIRIAHLSESEIVQRVQACRDVLPSGVRLAVDASQGLLRRPWTLREATRIGRLLEPYDLLWLEEPAEVTNYRGYGDLRARINVPIAGGESVTSLAEAQAYVDADALDLFQPDAAIIGGLTVFRQVAQMCERRSIPIAVHAWSGGVGVMANYHAAFASPNCTFLESPTLANPLRDRVLVEPLRFEDGRVQAPTGPGLGVKLPPELEHDFPFRPDSYFRIHDDASD